MDDVVAEYSPAHGIHIVLDNYCTHKRNEEWLAKNTNAHFHFTPTSASWLNQVEIWFGIFSRKALRRASFASPRELRQRIEDFIKRYNPDSKPFKWRKREVKGSQLKDNIVNLAIKHYNRMAVAHPLQHVKERHPLKQGLKHHLAFP